MASTVRPTSALIIGLIAGATLGTLLPLLAAFAGVLSWPGGQGGESGLGLRTALAGAAVVIATIITKAWADGSELRVLLSPAAGGLVGVPIAAAAAAWSQLYGSEIGPGEAAISTAGGVAIGALVSWLLNSGRAQQRPKEEWQVGPRAGVEWAELDVQAIKGRGESSPGSAAHGGREHPLSHDAHGG